MAKRWGSTVDEQLKLKPADFTWENQELLDQKTSEWMNRDKFSYDMHKDPLYQQYKEQYSALGKLAMEDTMGQAAAMTGGYGNSYAQSVGQQAYQQYMDQLNAMVPDLYAMARSDYEAEGQNLYNQIALLEGQRSQAFNEYQADMNDWYNYLNVLQQREASRGSGGGGSGKAYDLDEVKLTLENMTDEGMRKKYLSELMQMGMPPVTAYSLYAGSGSEASTTEDSAEETSPFVKANFMREDKDGNYVFEKGGKEYAYAKGINPYTGSKNPDTKNGTFTNGYQPNNVGGKKLTATGDYTYVNGVRQNIWKTEDGTRYVWDGTENRYIKETEIKYDY